MVRNLSFKTDDEFDDKLYSVSKKKGLTKSAFIRNEIEKVVDREFKNGDSNMVIEKEEFSNKNPVLVALEKKEIDLKEGKKFPESTSRVMSELPPEEKKPEVKSELIKPEIKIPDIKVNVNTENAKLEVKKEQDKKEQKKVFRLGNDEGNQRSADMDALVERKISGILNKKEFDSKIGDIHNRISKMDNQICEDGKCFRTDLADLKEKVKKLDILNTVPDIQKEIIELKNKVPKIETCPHCGQNSLVHLASYCSECGKPIKAWADESGKKIEGWKHSSERVKG